MVDSDSGRKKDNEEFKSDFESDKKKLDSKNENNLSFYECPTAAASIQGFGEGNRYSSNSLESDLDSNSLESAGKGFSSQGPSDREGFNHQEDNPNFTEGGSVSISQLTKVSGGYFAGYQAVLYQGEPKLKEKPESFFEESSSNSNQANPNLQYTQTTGPNLNPVPEATPFLTEFQSENSFPVEFPNLVSAPPVSSTLVNPTLSTAMQPVTYHSNMDTSVPFSVTSVRSENNTSRNGLVNTGTNSLSGLSPSVTNLPQTLLLPSVAESNLANSEYSWTGQTSSGLSYVQEGFGTITVPKYRPVEVVERTVEVPVVHHIDTFVKKKEIQEVESYVKKPYTKYVDKVVEVPQVHYTDKIVEVPEYHQVTKTVPKVEVQEKTNYVPKVEVKVVPKYVEVPVVKIVDKYEEYEQVEEVVKHVEKVEVVEVPREVVKTVVKPVKKIVEKEKIVPVYEHRDVPVEKIKYVPKVQTVEHLREVPQVVDVPVPYNVPKHQYVDQPYVVPKYRDVPVAVPVAKTVKPIYEPGPTNYVDVPVHKPYFVIHDHLNFKAVNSNSFSSNNLNPSFNVDNHFNNTNNFPEFPGFQPNPNLGVNPNFNNFGNVTGSNPGNFPNDPNGQNPTGFDNFPRPNNDQGPMSFGNESVSYRVVGMNRLDLNKMSPEEKKLAQEKLDEAINNPNFQVYKDSVTNKDFKENPEENETYNFPNFTYNFTNFDPNLFHPVSWTTGLKVDKTNFDKDKGFNGNDNVDFKKRTGGKFGGNWNKWSHELGSKYGPANWNKWNPENPNLNFDPNLNNKYKFDGNLNKMGSNSGSLSNWTEKLFQFFTGSKSPVNSNPLNAHVTGSNRPSNPPFNVNLQTNGPLNDNPVTTNNPFKDNLSGPQVTNKFWNKNNYNLVQETFRNWKVPNLHLDLEKNTPTNKMFFKDTDDQYYMSSGSGSVGHRAAQQVQKGQVYPTSDSNTPKVF